MVARVSTSAFIAFMVAKVSTSAYITFMIARVSTTAFMIARVSTSAFMVAIRVSDKLSILNSFDQLFRYVRYIKR